MWISIGIQKRQSELQIYYLVKLILVVASLALIIQTGKCMCLEQSLLTITSEKVFFWIWLVEIHQNMQLVPYFMLLHCQILMINIFQPWKMVTLSTFPHFNFHLGTSEKKRWHTILKVFSLSIIKILTINIISKLIE